MAPGKIHARNSSLFARKIFAYFGEALVQALHCRASKTLLLHLEPPLQLAALDVRQEEARDELPHRRLLVLIRPLETVHGLVDLRCLDAGFCKCAGLGRLIHRLTEDLFEVRIDGGLMDVHHLAEHLVLAISQTFFRLAPTRLLRLAEPPVLFRQLDHRCDAALLLEAQKLL